MSRQGYDFGGYATRADLQCADGRVIRRDAFKDNDGQEVPLVWGHQHNDPELVLGHALLENREDGVYAYCKLNGTPKAKVAKELVRNGDIHAFSIYANNLVQNGKDVMHGVIREVSLVLSGANPGALIENTAFAHGDGFLEAVEDEATIFNGFNLERDDSFEHASNTASNDNKDDSQDDSQDDSDKQESGNDNRTETDMGAEDKTIGDVIETLNPEQKKVLDFLVGKALMEEPPKDRDDQNDDEDDDQHVRSSEMKHNAFEDDTHIAHSAIDEQGLFDAVMNDARNGGGRFKDAFLRHAEEYGVVIGDENTFDGTIMHAAGSASNADGKEPFNYGLANPSIMFPDAHWATNEPDLINYDQTWVNAVMNGIGKIPFSRIRTHDADIRIEEARAKGYVRTNEKSDVFYSVAKRETTPTTVYIKTQFNRDDIQDITSFDVVNYTRTQIMRPKLNEELARAILFGDGRSASSADKINENCIRPVLTDDEHYTVRTVLAHDEDKIYDMIEEIGAAQEDFKGKSAATFFTTFRIHNKMKWAKNDVGDRIYKGGDAELIGDLGVNSIVEVENFMDNLVTTYDGTDYRVVGIKVSLGDYNVGTDRGGSIFNAEDFDIDFNQYKYLMETRMSGALARFHSAQVFLVPYTWTYTPATVTIGAAVEAGTYYERSGTGTTSDPYVYTLTDDTTFQSGTTYYTRA